MYLLCDVGKFDGRLEEERGGGSMSHEAVVKLQKARRMSLEGSLTSVAGIEMSI